jgi:pimeloyl-ACP methyl ester carboxylesterase
LGADEKMFEFLNLASVVRIKHLKWIEPNENEDITHYAKRMSGEIEKGFPFFLIGLSFGGIVAIEINKLFPAKKVIIISSITSKEELPSTLNIAKKLHLHNISPTAFLRYPNPVTYWFFGIKTLRERSLLKSYLNNMTVNYLKWSTNVILNWENKERPKNVFHIHGSNDRIFTINKIKADVVIPKAGHFMIHNEAEKISKIISEQLNDADSD